MASTYEPIATTTLGSAASSITFSSIPATYTDLRVVLVGTRESAGTIYAKLRFNNDSGSNYSSTRLIGDGSAAYSSRRTSLTELEFQYWDGMTYSTPAFCSADIFSYADSTYKSVLLTNNDDKNGSGAVEYSVGLWRSTSAINRIDIINSGYNFASGTTATIYGIKAA